MKKVPLNDKKSEDKSTENKNNGILKRDLFTLQHAILQVGDLPGKKFSYAMLRNLNRIKAEIEEIKENQKTKNEKVKLYLELVETLQKEHSRKDIKGEPKVKKNAYGESIIEFKDPDKYLEDLKKLKLAYPDEVAELERDEKELEEILDKPAEFQIHAVQFEELPDAITPAQMNGIEKLIEGMDD